MIEWNETESCDGEPSNQNILIEMNTDRTIDIPSVKEFLNQNDQAHFNDK